MNAVSAPSCISPDWIRCPPNQTTPTEDRFTTSMISGIMPATSSAELQVVPGQVLVGPVEAPDLVVLPDEAADDVGADDLLAQHPADPVDELLALPVERNEAAHDQDHNDRKHRNHRDDDAGQRNVLVHGEHDAADEDGRCRDQHREHQDHEVLDLRDVVGGPGDEAGGPERADFLGGQGLHFGEQLFAQLPAEFHGHDGAEVAGGDGSGHLDAGDRRHPGPQAQDLRDVSARRCRHR